MPLVRFIVGTHSSICIFLVVMYFGMALLFHTQSVVAKSPWLLWNKIGLRLLTSTTQSLISSSLSPKATSSTQRYSTLPSISLSTVEHDRAERFLKFLDKSTDPFHAVETVSEELHKAGFHKLCEGEDWSQGNILHPGGKYFFTRQDSSLVAFTVGQQFTAGHGFKILAAHTDSPHLKIKPRSRRNSHSGVVQLNVECYGGGLWHTWFDRDLAISGRVMVRDAKNPQKVHRQLVNINRSILRIPSLCVHLRNADEREVFKFNKEEHLPPILCDHTTQLLSVNRTVTGESSWSVSQEPFLLTLLAEHLKCKEKDIADFELSIYDVQNSSRSGMMNEYICGSRLDNLASCFTIMESLIDHSVNLENDADVSMMALFDHEEVGSDSITGAGSTLVMDSIDRLSTILHRSKMDQYKELLYNAKSRSFIVSVDMAHAVHPNYPGKHDKFHTPTMNNGIVVKSNSNQKYSTSGLSGFLIRELGRYADVNMQEFSVRNDCPCGSTIGPILSTKTGIRAVDVGMPQLSMHSIREMMGSKDLTHAHKLFTTFLKNFSSLDQSIH